MNEVYAGLIRHTLTVVCGILVSKGVIDASNAEIAVGSLMGLIGVIWSVKSKK